MLALGPLVVVDEPDEADKRTGRLVLDGPQAEATLFPMANEPRDLPLALLAGEWGTPANVTHQFRIGTETRVRVDVLVSPPAQQKPLGLDHC